MKKTKLSHVLQNELLSKLIRKESINQQDNDIIIRVFITHERKTIYNFFKYLGVTIVDKDNHYLDQCYFDMIIKKNNDSLNDDNTIISYDISQNEKEITLHIHDHHLEDIINQNKRLRKVLNKSYRDNHKIKSIYYHFKRYPYYGVYAVYFRYYVYLKNTKRWEYLSIKNEYWVKPVTKKLIKESIIEVIKNK